MSEGFFLSKLIPVLCVAFLQFYLNRSARLSSILVLRYEILIVIIFTVYTTYAYCTHVNSIIINKSYIMKVLTH